MKMMEYPPIIEQSPALPTGFAELREKINEVIQKPLEERFAQNPEELARLTTPENLENFKKFFPSNHEGRAATDMDIENYRKEFVKRQTGTLFESELMELLATSSLLPRNSENPLENGFEKPFACVNEECLETENLVKGVYRGYEKGQLSGDSFRITQHKTESGTETDMLLVDAQGHGGGAAPLALLTTSFLQAAEKEGIEAPLIALDAYVSSLPLNRQEISLQKITVKNRTEDSTKTLSIIQAGGMYAFWVEGDEHSGWKLKVIAPEKIEGAKSIEPITLQDGSALGEIGQGYVEDIYGTPRPQIFSLSNKAAVFLSSDGIFDAQNPETKNRLVEELSDVITPILQKNGLSRKEIENNILQQITKCSEKYTQTDDETFFKIAA